MLVGPNTERTLGEAEPNRTLALKSSSERAIIDERVPDRFDAARFGERIAAEQHAPARCRCGRAIRLVDPGERIKHLEEEDESGDEATFRKARAAQLRHQA